MCWTPSVGYNFFLALNRVKRVVFYAISSSRYRTGLKNAPEDRYRLKSIVELFLDPNRLKVNLFGRAGRTKKNYVPDQTTGLKLKKTFTKPLNMDRIYIL